MRRNQNSGVSFLIGLLVGLCLLAFVVFALFYGNRTPAAPGYATATPEVVGTPGVPVTGGEPANPVRTGVDYFFYQVNHNIIQPFLNWLGGRTIIIETTPPPPVSEPNTTPVIVVTPTP